MADAKNNGRTDKDAEESNKAQSQSDKNFFQSLDDRDNQAGEEE